MRNQPRKIELLAPARNADIAIEAIKHGADAVYMGASSHGARAAAGNSIAEVERVVQFAHRFRAKVYITVNTIIYDEELAEVERLIHELYRVGVDALIVQDMALLRMNLPPIALHASTQCDIHSVDKAKFLQQAGFSQIVVARELSLDEMAEIHRQVNVPIEAFVHGALCVSYSGDCQAGFATMRRSANRGECPQICRHKFNLEDSNGNVLIEGKHLLSLRDLNRSAHLEAMLNAGVSSFKIEGRLKDVAYVKNVVGAYRAMLDDIINAYLGSYERSSIGYSKLSFTPDLSKSFNRGYTDYFTITANPQKGLAAINTPKWVGEPIGMVVSVSQNRIKAKLTTTLANGDGLGYFNAKREFEGFRLNRVEGDMLYPAQPINVPVGATLYRNSDKIRSSELENNTSERCINVDFKLRTTSWGIALDIVDEVGNTATATVKTQLSQARTPQIETRREVLKKTGDTIYSINTVVDTIGDLFVPKSMLAALRRKAIEALECSVLSSYHYDYRAKEQPNITLPQGSILTYHDNVANNKSELFYQSHGAEQIQSAIEIQQNIPKQTRVMTTRYCLRREMGRCLRTSQGALWPRDLYLTSGPIRLALEFDCVKCRMYLTLE